GSTLESPDPGFAFRDVAPGELEVVLAHHASSNRRSAGWFRSRALAYWTAHSPACDGCPFAAPPLARLLDRIAPAMRARAVLRVCSLLGWIWSKKEDPRGKGSACSWSRTIP